MALDPVTMPLTDEQAALVRAVRLAEVPLDLLRVAVPRTEPPDAAHRAAAVHAVAAFAGARGVPDDGATDPGALVGMALTVADLRGRRADPAGSRLLDLAGDDYFQALGPDTPAVAVPTGDEAGRQVLAGPLRFPGDVVDRWLVHDPAGPVWGLGDVLAETGGDDALFAALARLLGADAGVAAAAGAAVEAYRWHGDWSRYFDDGNDWLGTGGAWTVRTDGQHVLVLAASLVALRGPLPG